MAAVLRVAVIAVIALLALAAGAQGSSNEPSGPLVQVVLALDQAPVADSAPVRTLSARGGTARRLNLRAPASVSRLRTLASAQRSLQDRLEDAVPGASVRWRYRIVANGIAVVLPASEVDRASRLPGVRAVFPSISYGPALDRAPQQVGAPQLWGPDLTGSTGAGRKIAVIDTGIDTGHPFFDPTGYVMPAGFPKGQRAFTSAKVIVARAFPPPGADWRGAGLPFHGGDSDHGTHVAGIAAGNANTTASGDTGRVRVSGIAPGAYIGNYNALTIPSQFGLNGNSPELVAAIEAAVADGMDVINMSLAEAEIEPSRDLVALALDRAARAGVVPVVSGGNSFDELGRGSVNSPASSARAISVGAVSTTRGGQPNTIASFSSAGPTPLSLRLKPDVLAPGSSILSSVPGGWELLSGTSMSSPVVAGAAALLRQRHPEWSVAQLKSALMLTAGNAAGAEPVTRQGAGVIDLVRADAPLLFTSPSSLSFGLVRRGTTATQTLTLADAGGGPAPWTVAVERGGALRGVTIAPSAATATAPGTVAVRVATAAGAQQGEISGRLVLTRGTDVRRVPFWLRVTAPTLPRPARVLTTPGVYRGSTAGRPARVAAYRYPDGPNEFGFATTLNGPEQVFRVRLRRAAVNFGVVITQRAQGVRVEPRVVYAGDENRLTGLAALPFNGNPYQRTYGNVVLVAGAILPRAGNYDIVFDSAARRGAGAFTFRLWLNDTTPPAVSLASREARRDGVLTARVSDRGSGIDPASVLVEVDGRERGGRLADGRLTIPVAGLGPGRHTLRIQISDYQETRNMENSGRLLPNTRDLRTTFAVR
jgi:subtilisin family serine protease